MRTWQRPLAAGSIGLIISTPSYGRKVPLTPERLLSDSDAIIVGQVQSHRDEERTRDDGSKTKEVFLTVRAESVEKGAETIRIGDDIQALCWVVVRWPRVGMLWDAGHGGIPGDGGRAKFFLQKQSGTTNWAVIYPNGMERLDETPILRYPMEPVQWFGLPRNVVLVIGGLSIFALLVWWFVRTKNSLRTRGEQRQ